MSPRRLVCRRYPARLSGFRYTPSFVYWPGDWRPDWEKSFMPDRRKSYVGLIEHDELSFKPQQFTTFLAGHLGWQIRQPLKIDFPAGRELAIIGLTRAYRGQASVE